MNRGLVPFLASASLLAAAPARADTFQVDMQQIGAVATVTQVGDANTATVTQTGAKRPTATVSQTGDGNIATVRQGPPPPSSILTQGVSTIHGKSPVLGADYAVLSQTGDNNTGAITQMNPAVLADHASLTQTGSGDTAALTQTGSGDTAIGVQNGSGDAMSIVQRAVNDYASYTQNGDNLPDIAIRQTGVGASVTVVQTAPGH